MSLLHWLPSFWCRHRYIQMVGDTGFWGCDHCDSLETVYLFRCECGAEQWRNDEDVVRR